MAIQTLRAKQGLRIINVFSIKLAPRHGFLVQNRAIMRYTLIVAKFMGMEMYYSAVDTCQG